MKKTKLTISGWVKQFKDGWIAEALAQGEHSPGVLSDMGWIDWFAHDNSLIARTRELVKVIIGLNKESLCEWQFVLKNSCPASDDPTYDQIYLYPTGEGMAQYRVNCKDRRSMRQNGNLKWTVDIADPDNNDMVMEAAHFRTVREVVKYIAGELQYDGPHYTERSKQYYGK